MIVVGGPHCGLREESTLGGEVYERNLLARLPEHGIQLELGLPRSRSLERVPRGWCVTPLRPGRGLRWYVAPAAFVPYAAKLLRERRVQLLRGHSVLFTGPSLLAARRLAGSSIPIVLHHLHTDELHARVEGAILRRADAVITISEASRRQLLAAGVEPARIHLVYPGTERPQAETPLPRDLWAARRLRLLFLGRLIPRKRPHVAIEALRAALKRGVAASLVIAGEGPLERHLRRLAEELGVAPHVSFVGAVSPLEKWGLYRSSDVLLFTSGLEGFGFVAAEAQASGLPVVAVAGTAAAEIVIDDETGLLVPASGEAFGEAVGRMSSPQVRAAMGVRAREATKRFDWRKSAQEVASVYAAIAESDVTQQRPRRGTRSH